MKKIVFMGTPDFAVPVLDMLVSSEYEVVLVVTQPDRPVGRRRKLTPPPVKTAAEKHNIPIFQPEKISEDYEEIFKYDADIIVTAAYGQLLPNKLLEQPPYKCINVHASLLPELRGGAPIHYSILQGKKETGITIMYMVEKLDAGDIISQQKVIIEEDDNVGILHDKLAAVGPKLLKETLPKIFANEISPIKQAENLATFAPNITRDDEKIDWSKSNEDIYNKIRGLNPWPVAYTTYKDERLKIWWATKVDQVFENSEPGEIIQINDNKSIIVACGNNKGVQIEEIQPAGKKRMTVEQFLRGSAHLIESGTKME